MWRSTIDELARPHARNRSYGPRAWRCARAHEFDVPRETSQCPCRRPPMRAPPGLPRTRSRRIHAAPVFHVKHDCGDGTRHTGPAGLVGGALRTAPRTTDPARGPASPCLCPRPSPRSHPRHSPSRVPAGPDRPPENRLTSPSTGGAGSGGHRADAPPVGGRRRASAILSRTVAPEGRSRLPRPTQPRGTPVAGDRRTPRHSLAPAERPAAWPSVPRRNRPHRQAPALPHDTASRTRPATPSGAPTVPTPRAPRSPRTHPPIARVPHPCGGSYATGGHCGARGSASRAALSLTRRGRRRTRPSRRRDDRRACTPRRVAGVAPSSPTGAGAVAMSAVHPAPARSIHHSRPLHLCTHLAARPCRRDPERVRPTRRGVRRPVRSVERLPRGPRVSRETRPVESRTCRGTRSDSGADAANVRRPVIRPPHRPSATGRIRGA